MRLISQRNLCNLLGWDRIEPIYWEGVESFLYHPIVQNDLTSAEVNRTVDFLTPVNGQSQG
jgi:hypothetical protein